MEEHKLQIAVVSQVKEYHSDWFSEKMPHFQQFLKRLTVFYNISAESHLFLGFHIIPPPTQLLSLVPEGR